MCLCLCLWLCLVVQVCDFNGMFRFNKNGTITTGMGACCPAGPLPATPCQVLPLAVHCAPICTVRLDRALLRLLLRRLLLTHLLPLLSTHTSS